MRSPFLPFGVPFGLLLIHDLQATIVHCLGIDHTRLTDVHGHVVKDILA